MLPVMTTPSSPPLPAATGPGTPPPHPVASDADTGLSGEYLRGQIRADAERIAEVARMGTSNPVPACPGWNVADLVEHVAAVYLHKVIAMRTNAKPDPWPPDFTGRDPLDLFDEARADLLAELEKRGTDSPAWTFAPDDQTSGFWHRRMAHESAIHRIDAEQANDVVTPLDPALSLDGIDEVLQVMLAGPWWEDYETTEPLDAIVRITSGGRSWTADVRARSVTITDGAEGDVAAEIFGEPADLLVWLWGRADDDVVQAASDGDIVRRFHRRLTETLN